jgi:two-component system sensor histidine kinase/response regulator
MVASMKQITLSYLDTSEKIKIHADQDMLKTVLRNFISNAIKFSNNGSSIEVFVTRQDKFAKISVQDHGMGISEENQSKLFKTETNYTTYGTANEEGSGLGLLLCKDFAVKNGGDISLESKEGVGSIFSILLPICND